MPLAKKYLFVVTMDVQKEKEALFNEVYDTEHVPLLPEGAGRRRGDRGSRPSPPPSTSAASARCSTVPGMASYVAIYEIDSPDVLLSKEWAEAAEKGRWPSEVRPYTFNRNHVVRKVL
jgi:hypothetical protein